MKKKCRVYRELPKAQGSGDFLGRYNYNMLDPDRKRELNLSAGTGWNTYTGLTGSLDASLPIKFNKRNSSGISNIIGRGYMGQNQFGKTSGFNLGLGFENRNQGQDYQPFISGGFGYDNQLGWNTGFNAGGRWPINFDIGKGYKRKNIDGSFGWNAGWWGHTKADPSTGHIKPTHSFGSPDQSWSGANSGRHMKANLGLFGDISTKLGPGNLTIYGQANINPIRGKSRRGDLSVPIEEDRSYIDRQTSSHLEFAPEFTLGARYNINTGIPKIKDIVKRREAEEIDKKINERVNDQSVPSILKAGGENKMPFNELSQGSGSKPEGSSYLQGFIGTMQENVKNFQTDGPIADSIDILNYASDGLPEFKKSGSKKKWIQGAVKQMKNKGTVGAFTQYCGGKVTAECIERGLNSPDETVQKRARFAKAMRNVQAGGEVFNTYKAGGNLPSYEINGGIPFNTQAYDQQKYIKQWLDQKPIGFSPEAYARVAQSKGPYDIKKGFKDALGTAMKDWSHSQYYAPEGVPEDAIITGYEPGMGKETSKLYYFDPANPKQPNTNITAQQNITSHPLQGTPTYDANQAYFPPPIYKRGGNISAFNDGYIPMFQPGGTYKDSLALYKAYMGQKEIMQRPYVDAYGKITNTYKPEPKKTSPFQVITYGDWGIDDWENAVHWDKDAKTPDHLKSATWWKMQSSKDVIKLYEKLGLTDRPDLARIAYYSSPDIFSDKIKPTGTYWDGSAYSPIYPKPVSPPKKLGVIRKPPPPVKLDIRPVQTIEKPLPEPLIKVAKRNEGTVKPPRSTTSWHQDPHTGTWFQRERPVVQHLLPSEKVGFVGVAGQEESQVPWWYYMLPKAQYSTDVLRPSDYSREKRVYVDWDDPRILESMDRLNLYNWSQVPSRTWKNLYNPLQSVQETQHMIDRLNDMKDFGYITNWEDEINVANPFNLSVEDLYNVYYPGGDPEYMSNTVGYMGSPITDEYFNTYQDALNRARQINPRYRMDSDLEQAMDKYTPNRYRVSTDYGEHPYTFQYSHSPNERLRGKHRRGYVQPPKTSFVENAVSGENLRSIYPNLSDEYIADQILKMQNNPRYFADVFDANNLYWPVSYGSWEMEDKFGEDYASRTPDTLIYGAEDGLDMHKKNYTWNRFLRRGDKFYKAENVVEDPDQRAEMIPYWDKPEIMYFPKEEDIKLDLLPVEPIKTNYPKLEIQPMIEDSRLRIPSSRQIDQTFKEQAAGSETVWKKTTLPDGSVMWQKQEKPVTKEYDYPYQLDREGQGMLYNIYTGTPAMRRYGGSTLKAQGGVSVRKDPRKELTKGFNPNARVDNNFIKSFVTNVTTPGHGGTWTQYQDQSHEGEVKYQLPSDREFKDPHTWTYADLKNATHVKFRGNIEEKKDLLKKLNRQNFWGAHGFRGKGWKTGLTDDEIKQFKKEQPFFQPGRVRNVSYNIQSPSDPKKWVNYSTRKYGGNLLKAQASTSLPGQMPTSTYQFLNNPLWNPNWAQDKMNQMRYNSQELELEKIDDGDLERTIYNMAIPSLYGIAHLGNAPQRKLAEQMQTFYRSPEESTAISLAGRGHHEVDRNPFTPGLTPNLLRGSFGAFEQPVATAQFGLSVGDTGEYSDKDLQALIDAGYEFEYI